MARDRDPDRESAGGGIPAELTSRLFGAGFIVVLGMAILRVAMGRPEWIASWKVTAAFLVFAGSLILATYRYGPPLVRPLDRALSVLRLGLLFVLLVVVIQSATPGFGAGIDRSTELAVVFAALVAFCVLASDPRQYSPGQWLFIGCFATVTGIFFLHGLSVGEVSARARQPLWWGVLVGVNLLVLPRYLSTDQFLWTLNRLAALLVLLALPIYVVGEYTLFGLQFTFHGAYDLPVLGREVRATRSLFVNRNTFAEVVFVGVVAGAAEAHRAIRRGGWPQLAGMPSQLLVVNLLGLALAYDRAMWVITPVAVGIYLAYVTFGRRSVPLSVTAGIVFLFGGLLAVYLGVLDTHTSNRFALWRGGLAAIADQPSLLGEGLVPPGRFMADYHDLGSVSPHNSYISIWIRTGILGGVAYATLVAGSVPWGAIRFRNVDVAALALAAGFAAHQLFEAYTLYQSGMGSVLATLAVGFLIFGGPHDDSGGAESDVGDVPDEESGGSTATNPAFSPDFVGEEEGAPYEVSGGTE